jgi:hypothetical protein
MSLVTFNVPEEIKDRLRLEENQSALITSLLMDYFEDMKIEDYEKHIKTLETKSDLQREAAKRRIEELRKKVEKKREIENIEEKKRMKGEIIKKARETAIIEI